MSSQFSVTLYSCGRSMSDTIEHHGTQSVMIKSDIITGDKTMGDKAMNDISMSDKSLMAEF